MNNPIYFSDFFPFISILVGGFVMIITIMRQLNLRQKFTADFNLNFYLAGVIIAQLLTLFVINLESRNKNEVFISGPIIEDDRIEMPRTIFEKPKVVLPPAPKVKKPNVKPVLTKIIELVDDKTTASDPVMKDPEVEAFAPPIPTVDPALAPPVPEPIIEDEPDAAPLKFAEQMPRFPGCEDLDAGHESKKACADAQLLKYIYDHLRYPVLARENGVEGMAILQFVVARDGSVTDITIVRDPGAGCGHAAKEVVAAMNQLPERWTPGRQRGRPVKVLYTLPVSFRLR